MLNDTEELNATNVNNRVLVNRPVYTLKSFENEFYMCESTGSEHVNSASDANSNSSRQYMLGNIVRTGVRCLNPINLLRIFTIFGLFAGYNVKKNLLADLLSGITVGVMNIPSALAYGALTSLNPVHGLYTSFYGGLIYVLFGTSKHLSVGTFAVTSLMVFSTICRIETEHAEFAVRLGLLNSTHLHDQVHMKANEYHKFEEGRQAFKLKIATCLAFWCGIFQVGFSLIRFGLISKYFPQPLLRGFTTAAGFHVFSSQIKHVFGIYVVKKKARKLFKLVYVYVSMFENIAHINWAAFILATSSIFIIIVVKLITSRKLKHFLGNIPFPIELLILIISTAVTYLAKLDKKFNLPIVGAIPEGFSLPSLPEFSLFAYVVKDAFLISIVAFASSISVADLYARKHKYKINSNKEFFALGMANIVGSFFKCFVSCASLARTVVFESSGGKTQMVTIFSSGIILTVILWLSPLLETLPKACLASIIIVAILNILKQIKDIRHYWKIDKLDCITWLITFTSSILLDIDYGLGIGVLTVLFLNTYRSQNLELTVIGQIKDFEIYSDVTRFYTSEHESIKIIRPSHSIFYLNCDFFCDELHRLCPLRQLTKISVFENCNSLIESTTIFNKRDTIILDCTNIQYIDEAGFKCIQACIQEYQTHQVKFCLTNCHHKMLEFFERMKFKHEDVYMTVQDAVETFK